MFIFDREATLSVSYNLSIYIIYLTKLFFGGCSQNILYKYIAISYFDITLSSLLPKRNKLHHFV